MAKARRARILGIIWGAYAEPSSNQEELLRQQGEVAAQLIHGAMGGTGLNTHLCQTLYQYYKARLTATALRSTVRVMQSRLEAVASRGAFTANPASEWSDAPRGLSDVELKQMRVA